MWIFGLTALLILVALTVNSDSKPQHSCEKANLNFIIIDNLTTIHEWPKIYEKSINDSIDIEIIIKLHDQTSCQVEKINHWLKKFNKTILALCSNNSRILDNFDITIFSGLTTLRIGNSNIKKIGIMPFSELYKLENLDLAGNCIEMIANNSFPESLKILDLSNNNLTSIPDLSNLKNLQRIRLHGNPNLSLPKWPILCQSLPVTLIYLIIDEIHMKNVFNISQSDLNECGNDPYVFLNESSFGLKTNLGEICKNLTPLCTDNTAEKNKILPATEKLTSPQEVISTAMIVVIISILLIIIVLFIINKKRKLYQAVQPNAT